VGVLHVPTIKPFDTGAVIDFAKSVRQLVSAENHVVVGGLGSLVAETLFDAGISKKLTRIGIPDRYIECGSVPVLQDTYGLTTRRMITTMANLLEGTLR
jgi:transketolase